MQDLTKTTVYLPEADYRRLKAMARKQKRTTAELVREAVAQYAGSAAAKPTSLGIGHSGRGDLSERAEDLLKGMGRHR
jgi:ribbon-helix-helix CopG family protein